MKNILEEFANDNLHPNSRRFDRDSEYGRASKQVVNAEKALRAALSEPQIALLEQYIDDQEQLDYLSFIDRFIYGYRLSVLMTMEVYRTSDDLVVNGEG